MSTSHALLIGALLIAVSVFLTKNEGIAQNYTTGPFQIM